MILLLNLVLKCLKIFNMKILNNKKKKSSFWPKFTNAVVSDIEKRNIEDILSGFKSVKITKIADEKFNGNHPNDINEGYSTTGLLLSDIEVGKPALIGSLRTSLVTGIIDDNQFRTMNSKYKIEYL